MSVARPQFRSGRSMWAVLLYLAGFVVLLSLVSDYYLIPALIAKHNATPDQSRMLIAWSRLILALLLIILLVGLLVTFRIGRLFFPQHRDPVKPTEYVDAWQEAGRRLEVEEEEQDN